VAFVFVAIVSGWVAVQMVGNAVTPAAMPVLSSGEVASRLSTASPAATPTPDKSSPTKPKPLNKPSSKPTGKNTQQPTSQATSQSTTNPSQAPTSSSSPKPAPTKTSSPAPKTVARTIASRGGSVVAACTSGSVTLRSWSPAVGYRVDEVRRGPAAEAEIKFASSSNEVTLQVRCVSGVPSGISQVDNSSGDDD